MDNNERISRCWKATPRWDDEGPWCSYEGCNEWKEGRCGATCILRDKCGIPQACQAIAIALRDFMRGTQREQSAIVKEAVRQKTGTLKLEKCRWMKDEMGHWQTECGDRVQATAITDANEWTYCPRCGRPFKMV